MEVSGKWEWMGNRQKWTERVILFVIVTIVFVSGITIGTKRAEKVVRPIVNENASVWIFMAAQYSVLDISAEICRAGDDVHLCATLMDAHRTIVGRFIEEKAYPEDLLEEENERDRDEGKELQQVFHSRSARHSY